MHHRESRCSDREGATHLDALKLDTRLVQELYHCARLAVARADTLTRMDPPTRWPPHRDTPSRHPSARGADDGACSRTCAMQRHS